jgi:hypothetical protein
MDKGDKAFILDVAHRLDRLEEVICSLILRKATDSEWLMKMQKEIYEEQAAAESN